ncbi:retrovirus-related Pol polyprotein from transposon 412 [Trichonephila clavipes]|nr:retrovirus-related Pol polyprotein from transposon 412 [Trichonephila clavipes]
MYNGGESLGIRRFLGKINDVANLGKWSNDEKVTILKLKLAGIAEEFFLSDPTHSQLTEYNDIARILIGRFEKAVPLSTRLQLFSSCIQGPSESVQEFAARINKLGTPIFQSGNSAQNTAVRNAKDQLLQSRFISGLRNDIRRFVLSHDPLNLEESINAALIEEQNMKLNQIASEERSGLSSAQTENPVSALADRLQEINLRVGRLQKESAVTARKSGGNYFNRRENVLKCASIVEFKDIDRRNVERDRGTNALPVTSPPGETPQASILQVAPGQEGGMYISGNLLSATITQPPGIRRYIKNFAKRALPLTNLLRKDTPFEWTSETQEAFDDIKKAILNPPVLALPDQSAELQITTDASSRGIGAVLEQKYPNSEVKPLYFFSKKLNPSQSKYNATVLEFFAIYTALNFFRPFLLGRKFKVFTDHKPLAGFLSNKNPSSKILRRKLALEEFNYDIHYIRGSLNSVADHLSRYINNITIALPDSKDLINMQREDCFKHYHTKN